MSQYSLIASATGFSQVASSSGNQSWTTVQSTRIGTSIGPNGGTAWAIWSVHIPSAVPNETIDSIRFRNGHDYTVAAGAGTRVATVGVSIHTAFSDFANTSAGTVIGSRPGTGVGEDVDHSVPLSGYSSNNLRDGSFFVGVMATANGADPSWHSDSYRFGILTWDIYTSGTTPEPPVGQPYMTLTPGAGNASPGKYPGQSFVSTRSTWWPNGTGNPPYITFTWQITGGAGVTFANGTQTLMHAKGTVQDPGAWWYSDTGAISVAATAKPGMYALTCTASTGGGGFTFVQATQLQVQYPGYITTEF